MYLVISSNKNPVMENQVNCKRRVSPMLGQQDLIVVSKLVVSFEISFASDVGQGAACMHSTVEYWGPSISAPGSCLIQTFKS